MRKKLISLSISQAHFLWAICWNADDEYQIRRKSLELEICTTTIELADSFVKTLEWLQNNETTRDPIEPYDIIE